MYICEYVKQSLSESNGTCSIKEHTRKMNNTYICTKAAGDIESCAAPNLLYRV